MRHALIVSYDLANPEQNKEPLIQLIKDYPSWVRIGDSSYMISTDESPTRVRDTLSRVLKSDDSLYVGVVSAPAAWYGLTEGVSQWIHANQR